MAPEISMGSNKCGGIKVQRVAHILSVYHMVMSLILLIEYTIEVIIRKYCCLDVSKYYHIAEIASSYLLLTALIAINILFIFGILKKRGSLVMPFLSMQIMDFILSCLMLCSTYVILPSYIAANTQDHKLVSQKWKPLNIFLSLLTLCSFYVEIPSYLNLKSMNLMNYFPHHDSKGYVMTLVFFNLLYISVLFSKVYLIWCVSKCFKHFQQSNIPKFSKDSAPRDLSKVVLPSYEEAIKMAAIDLPPPYSTV
ncbi:lysosomal-associated transmembrane protein 5 [Bombina bombina]|uniref:lysosomal-associated transmembrane protein 5 n=1 Tax=Bombina bombina TaxID=8345 RepID=UPI00235AFC63|nr:lysosomal-associated transmembrane protein 5 [Bombina bombina]